jgi:hypothetical protein
MSRFAGRLAAGLAALALANPLAAEDTPKTYDCVFKAGSTITYSKGVYRAKPAAVLAFRIGDIDLDGQQAALVTDKGKGVLRIVRAVNANHYLEVVTEGFLNMTTIYDRDARRGLHPAAHSRHFGLFGEPVIAQYHGFCRGAE